MEKEEEAGSRWRSLAELVPGRCPHGAKIPGLPGERTDTNEIFFYGYYVAIKKTNPPPKKICFTQYTEIPRAFARRPVF